MQTQMPGVEAILGAGVIRKPYQKIVYLSTTQNIGDHAHS